MSCQVLWISPLFMLTNPALLPSLLPSIRTGDILESVNGISLTNADHRDAVRAVKESKGLLNIVSRCPTSCIAAFSVPSS